jgi:S1-C subfamily serine protease
MRQPDKAKGTVGNSIVVSDGKPAFKLRALNGHEGALIDSKSLPKDVLHWFEPADVGLEVSAAKEGVIVSKVASGMLPEKAGIQKGDRITAVDGKKVDSEDTFRVLLRRGSVRPSCQLTIRRGDQTLHPFVEFGDTLPKK